MAPRYGVYVADAILLNLWFVNTEHWGKYLNHYFLKLTSRMPSFNGKLTLTDGNEILVSDSQTVSQLGFCTTALQEHLSSS